MAATYLCHSVLVSFSGAVIKHPAKKNSHPSLGISWKNFWYQSREVHRKWTDSGSPSLPYSQLSPPSVMQRQQASCPKASADLQNRDHPLLCAQGPRMNKANPSRSRITAVKEVPSGVTRLQKQSSPERGFQGERLKGCCRSGKPCLTLFCELRPRWEISLKGLKEVYFR